MAAVILLTLLFNLTTAISVALTGDKSIIEGNFAQNVIKILFNWRFITAMILAVLSRFLFIAVNSRVNKLPQFTHNSTTISVFLTASSYIFIILANIIILHDRLTPLQIIGTLVIIGGVVLLMI